MTITGKTSSKQEQQWQAESDANTMARYQEILGDRSRMNRAVKVARQQAADLSKRVDAMNKVANTKTAGKSTGTSRTGKKR